MSGQEMFRADGKEVLLRVEKEDGQLAGELVVARCYQVPFAWMLAKFASAGYEHMRGTSTTAMLRDLLGGGHD
jgi:hypothetical protein